MLVMVTPTVLLDSPDDEPAWSDEDESLDEFPVEFQVMLTDDQHQEMVKKQATMRVTTKLDSAPLSPPSLDRFRVVTVHALGAPLADEKMINVKLRLDDKHVVTDDEVLDVERQELDKVTGDINAAVEAGQITRADADAMFDRLAKEAAERAAKAKHDEVERARQLEAARKNQK
jgi:hypothetical protein